MHNKLIARNSHQKEDQQALLIKPLVLHEERFSKLQNTRPAREYGGAPNGCHMSKAKG